MESSLQSSNGTIFNRSIYIMLDDKPQQVLSRKTDLVPIGVIMRVRGHGEWIYIDSAIDKKDYDGLPQLLEGDYMGEYAETTKDPGTTYTKLQVAQWDAQGIIKEIRRREYCICGQPRILCRGVCTFSIIPSNR